MPPRIQRAPSRHCLEFTLIRKKTCHKIKCYPLLNRIKKIYSPIVHLARPIPSLFIESCYKHLKKIENDELDEMYKRNWARYSKEGKLLFPCSFLSLTVTDYFKQPEV